MQPVSKKPKNPAGPRQGSKKIVLETVYMAPVRGFEPLTHRLTADCATIAPHRNGFMRNFDLKGLKISFVLPYCQAELNPLKRDLLLLR